MACLRSRDGASPDVLQAQHVRADLRSMHGTYPGSPLLRPMEPISEPRRNQGMVILRTCWPSRGPTSLISLVSSRCRYIFCVYCLGACERTKVAESLIAMRKPLEIDGRKRLLLSLAIAAIG